jgi:hypothetical protein
MEVGSSLRIYERWDGDGADKWLTLDQHVIYYKITLQNSQNIMIAYITAHSSLYRVSQQ